MKNMFKTEIVLHDPYSDALCTISSIIIVMDLYARRYLAQVVNLNNQLGSPLAPSSLTIISHRTGALEAGVKNSFLRHASQYLNVISWRRCFVVVEKL